jgi:hypothetical protein
MHCYDDEDHDYKGNCYNNEDNHNYEIDYYNNKDNITIKETITTIKIKTMIKKNMMWVCDDNEQR